TEVFSARIESAMTRRTFGDDMEVGSNYTSTIFLPWRSSIHPQLTVGGLIEPPSPPLSSHSGK
ncbi:MAG: hypothetical protein ABEI86_07530, partial [Halobacteriaceae archaeon]